MRRAGADDERTAQGSRAAGSRSRCHAHLVSRRAADRSIALHRLHTSGGIAPFPLTSYDDALAQHQTMTAAVQTRRMPPWQPADACQSLRDARRLDQSDIDTIVAWSTAGAPAGDAAEAPPAAAPPPGLTSVDARLDPGIDYLPRPDAAHPAGDYHCFALDPALSEDRDVVGIEVLPGQPSIVHHVLLFAVPPAAAQAADDAEAGPGWTCFGSPGVTGIPAIVGGLGPGLGRHARPEGTGIPVAAGSALVMQVHYTSTTRPRRRTAPSSSSSM